MLPDMTSLATFIYISPLLNNSEDDVTRYFRSGAKSSFNKNYVTIFEFFFEIYEPTNSKLAMKVDLDEIYTQSGYDITSHFRSAFCQYPLHCKQTDFFGTQTGNDDVITKIKLFKKTITRRESNTHLRAWAANVLSITLMLQRCLVMLAYMLVYAFFFAYMLVFVNVHYCNSMQTMSNVGL